MHVDTHRVWLQEGFLSIANIETDDAQLLQVLRDSLVTNVEVKEGSKWNWPLICEFLKCEKIISKKRLENASIARFFRRMLTFFSPQSGLFHTQSVSPETEDYVTAGTLLIKLLVDCDDGQKFLGAHGILQDICSLLKDLGPETSQISAANLNSQLVQHYFDFIAIMCKSTAGQMLLSDAHIFSRLYAMCEKGDRDDLLQLILKKMPWNINGHPRVLLTQIVTTVNVQMRRYATDYLRVLIQTNPETPPTDWMISTLVRQLYDRDSDVRTRALLILDEGILYSSVD